MNCAKAENTTTGRGRDGDAWSEQLLQRARATPKATMPARALTPFERAALEVLAGVLSIPKTIQLWLSSRVTKRDARGAGPGCGACASTSTSRSRGSSCSSGST
jgi:hypothetical protein